MLTGWLIENRTPCISSLSDVICKFPQLELGGKRPLTLRFLFSCKTVRKTLGQVKCLVQIRAAEMVLLED